jgi:hypothetical protein
MSYKEIKTVLLLQNESLSPLRLCLEPICEFFTIQPGWKIEVHAIFMNNTENLNFTIAPNGNHLTLYTPGEMAGYIDCFVVKDGVKLLPDG